MTPERLKEAYKEGCKKRRKGSYKRRKDYTKDCVACGEPFRPYMDRQVCCGELCSRRHWDKMRAKREQEKIPLKTDIHETDEPCLINWSDVQ